MAQQQLSHAWIFVSHSNHDLDKVRKIRNRLERQGAQPLLFLLRATFEKPHLQQLLFSEIDARNFFLYCRSAEAERSRWVQEEVAHVKSLLPGKVYQEVNLDWSWRTQCRRLDELSRASTVFFSYSRQDEGRVAWFRQLLVQNEFSVFKDDDISPGEMFAQRIGRALRAVAESGVFIMFLSGAALESSWVRHEWEQARGSQQTGRRIIVELEAGIAGFEPDAPSPLEILKFDEDQERQGLKLLRLLGLEKPTVERPDPRRAQFEV